MTTFTNVSSTVLEPGDPIRSVDIIAIKENTNWAHETLNQGNVDVQTFNASGTWTKPTINGTTAGRMARIQVWGGGGGAGRGANAAFFNRGGGGGGYNEITVPLSTLASSVTVTIGASGAGRTGSTGNGTAGGNSSFGSLVTAYGGGGGGSSGSSDFQSSGGGGGQLSAGVTGSSTSIGPMYGRPSVSSAGNDAGGGGTLWHGGTALYNVYTSVVHARGDAVYGGGAGGCGSIASSNGSSVYGGNGGDRNQAGVQPGGGGGGSSSNNGNGFNGGAGRVIVTVW